MSAALLAFGRIADAAAQQPLRYFVHVDSADLTQVHVELRIPDAPRELTLATYARPLDDRSPWRRIEGVTVQSAGTASPVHRPDSATWTAAVSGTSAIVRYRVRIPPSPPNVPRDAADLALTRQGGVLGGEALFLMVDGARTRPVTVSLELPDGWRTASGMPIGDAPRTFEAADLRTLLDAPILVGRFTSWSFANANATHRIAYLPSDSAAPFDTLALASAIERLVDQTTTLFQGVPYRAFVFMLVDDAVGSASRRNSMVIGAPSAALAKSPQAAMPDIAHAFVHAWNLSALHPVELGPIRSSAPPPSKSLWFTEGLTTYYGDVLRRRAGLATEDPTRVAHIERVITAYLTFADSSRVSAQQLSQWAHDERRPSARLRVQGELIGMLLDLLIRDQTNGVRSLDDLMRNMMALHAGDPGFTPEQLEAQVTATCGCDARLFLESFITGARPLDLNRYFRLAGLRVKIARIRERGVEVARATLEEIVGVDSRERQLRALFLQP